MLSILASVFSAQGRKSLTVFAGFVPRVCALTEQRRWSTKKPVVPLWKRRWNWKYPLYEEDDYTRLIRSSRTVHELNLICEDNLVELTEYRKKLESTKVLDNFPPIPPNSNLNAPWNNDNPWNLINGDPYYGVPPTENIPEIDHAERRELHDFQVWKRPSDGKEFLLPERASPPLVPNRTDVAPHLTWYHVGLLWVQREVIIWFEKRRHLHRFPQRIKYDNQKFTAFILGNFGTRRVVRRYADMMLPRSSRSLWHKEAIDEELARRKLAELEGRELEPVPFIPHPRCPVPVPPINDNYYTKDNPPPKLFQNMAEPPPSPFKGMGYAEHLSQQRGPGFRFGPRNKRRPEGT